ncbi:MAG: hypothetical protein AB1592_00815 [Pseudomonadota bacterium]
MNALLDYLPIKQLPFRYLPGCNDFIIARGFQQDGDRKKQMPGQSRAFVFMVRYCGASHWHPRQSPNGEAERQADL